MRTTSKVKALKYAIVLVLVIWMALPVASLFTEGDDGFAFSIGSESEFEVGETTEDAIRSNLEDSLSNGAVGVRFDGDYRDLRSEDIGSIAAAIRSSGASSYTAVDGNGRTVTLDSIDLSTDDAQVHAVRVNATDRFLDSISPSMTMEFALGDSDVSVPTDSRIVRNEGSMDIIVEVPQGLYDLATDLGCELVIMVGVHYMGLLEASVDVGMDDEGHRDADISVSGSSCTVTLDPDVDLTDLDDVAICGSEATLSGNALTFDIGGHRDLASFLESYLTSHGHIEVRYTGGSVSLSGAAANGIIGIVGILEGRA